MIGVGGVGHIALQLLRELGSSSTIAIDTDERRRRLAAELGADEVLDGAGSVDAVRELTGGRGADLVFDFVGTDQSHADSVAMLARGGTYSIIGYGGTVSVPSAVLVGERARRDRATSSAPGSTSGSSCSSTPPAGSCSRPRRTRWTPSTTCSRSSATARSPAAPCSCPGVELGGRRGPSRPCRRRRSLLAAQEVGRVEELGLLGQLLRRALVADAAALEHVRRSARAPSATCANCSIRSTPTPLAATACERRHEPLDDDRREAERELVDEDRRAGRETSACASTTICCSPPESRRHVDRPSASRARGRARARSAIPLFASSRLSEYVATRRLSSTVRLGQEPPALGDDRDAGAADLLGSAAA